jgi:lysozyme
MIEITEVENRLVYHEGMVLHVYTCPAGYKTIGVGRNIETNPLTEEEKKACPDYEHGITKNGAMLLLRNDINKCIEKLKKNLPWYKELDDERQYALLDMCFNLGIARLLKFKNMLSYMEKKDFTKASEECLNSNYARQVPKRANRIAKLIKTGIWEI